MGTVVSSLRAKFGVDTSDLKQGLKDGEKAVEDFKGAAGSSVEKLADLFGVNMSAVNDALQTTQRSLNFLGQSFGAAAKGGNILALAMKVLKVALISTGIGALIVALGSLVSYFTKSGKGADQLAVALAQIKSVVNNVIERLAVMGEGLMLIVTGKFREGWDKLKQSVKGVGDEIREDWKAAGDLARREDELYDKETALITAMEERGQQIEELRLKAKDQALTEKENQQALAQAMQIRQGMINDEVSLEQERLAIMKEKLALQSKDPTDEQLREIAEQEAKISRIRAAGTAEIRGMTREYNSLTAQIQKAAEAEKKLGEEAEKAWQKMVNDAKPEVITPLMNIDGIKGQLAEVKGAVVETMSSLDKQLNEAIEGSLENLGSGIGEMLGSLAIGQGGFQDFGIVVAQALADMAITVGKIAIGAGIAVSGIKAALETLNPVAAIVAGVALVALGSAVKGALANVAAGNAGVSALSSGESTTFDTRVAPSSSRDQNVNVRVSGQLVTRGRDLVHALQQEQSWWGGSGGDVIETIRSGNRRLSG